MQNITSYYSKALKRGRPLKSGSETLKINPFSLYHPPPPKKKQQTKPKKGEKMYFYNIDFG